MAAVSGVFSTQYGDIEWTYYDWDVRLTGVLSLGSYSIRVGFYMRKNDDDWVRDGSHGAAEVIETDSGKAVFSDLNQVDSLFRLTFKEVKGMLNAVRDGWRSFIRAHPNIRREHVRERFRQRLRTLVSEREGIQALLDHKSAEIRLVEEIVAAEDPEATWKEVEIRWPKSPWSL